MYLLGYDIGSSSVKASIIDAETGKLLHSVFYPEKEMEIMASQKGWAEQNPQEWWENLKIATSNLKSSSRIDFSKIKAIGISYQMHGLVIVDEHQNVLRPSIIWCDSRAAEIGKKAFNDIGKEKCLSKFLNSPGNFTASKFKWVKENEEEVFKNAFKIMLPGDYIALKLTGKIRTTASGLSEGILWDFTTNSLAHQLMDYFGFDESVIPEIVPTFSPQGKLTNRAAQELGLSSQVEVAYRAGDQPNNAFSLNVLEPGEVAATGGTSGVVYGISDELKYDIKSRVNTFLHVNNSAKARRLGVLLCVNGTGILYSWLNKLTKADSYVKMNEMAASIQAGANGLRLYPFGNGAERIFEDSDLGASIENLNFNIHTQSHLYRAAIEGIAFSFMYGMEIMKETGINVSKIKAGNANLFLSPVFRDILSAISGAEILLMDTDGAQGAARGAGVGIGLYKSYDEAFSSMKIISEIKPNMELAEIYKPIYEEWKSGLEKKL